MGFKTKTFLNNNPPALEDVDLNGYKNEFNNSFTAAGLTPSDGDLQQTAKSMSIHTAGSDYYTDGGAANAYILSPSGSFLAPEAYFVGMKVRFVPSNDNTGASTVNVDGLGVKNIKINSGLDPLGGQIQSGLTLELTYDGTDFVIAPRNQLKIFENKLLTADVTTNGVMTDLSYTLTVGETYQIYAQMFLFIDDTVSQSIEVQVKDGTTVIGRTLTEIDIPSGSRRLATIYNTNLIRTMTNTSLTFEALSASAQSYVRGNNTFSQTYVTVTRVPDYLEGTVS